MTDKITVVVKFGGDIGPDEQAKALFDFEKNLCELTRKDCRVYKDLMGDDSKLRRSMTIEQRDKL